MMFTKIIHCKFSFIWVDNAAKIRIIKAETSARPIVVALKQMAGSVSVHLRSFELGFDSIHGLT